MAGLQRSAVSFRRQGSSGLVWDDRFLSEELNKASHNQEHPQEQDAEDHKPEIRDADNTAGTALRPINTIERSRSNGGARGYRIGKVSPAVEPPSPKLSAFGCCGAFGKTGEKGQGQRAKQGKHRSR